MGNLSIRKLAQAIVIILTLLASAATTAQMDQPDQLYVGYVAFSPDGSKIAGVGRRISPDEGYIVIIDALTEAVLLSPPPFLGGFTSLAWSPDGRFIAVGRFDATIYIIDTADGSIAAILSGHASTVAAVDWSSDGSMIMSGGNWDEKIILWDAATFQLIRVAETRNGISTLKFSPDNATVAVGGDLGLFIYPSSLELETEQVDLNYLAAPVYAHSVAWSPGGDLIAMGTQVYELNRPERRDAYLYVFDVANQATVRAVASAWGTITGVGWSPDGQLIATYHIDNYISIWDAATLELRQTFNADESDPWLYASPLAFSQYGGRLAYGSHLDYDSAPSNGAIEETSEIAAFSSLADRMLQIIVPVPSLEGLNAIAELCVRDSARPALAAPLTDQPITEGTLPAFVAQIETLPADAIPPACRADLLAVAEALGSQL